jgi:hypothetical protein
MTVTMIKRRPTAALRPNVDTLGARAMRYGRPSCRPQPLVCGSAGLICVWTALARGFLCMRTR